ncbi:neurotrimin-like isoform X2 [Venturia canescens]|uniref:neurotrimin-like isoform X2 n=1 Tax=Venturia canescens TaxID=32260 RepID=UPI001C9CF395|nr:neurotrimin-like isoform X2 [Venturia canescens]
MSRVILSSSRVISERQRLVPFLVLATLLVGVRPQIVEPNFKEPIKNETVPVGREAILACLVQDLAVYKVAWLRVDTQTILTIANHVITKNHRIAVTHSDHRTWFLHIREVRESDRGWYMCQINTDPMKSQNGYLHVVVPPDIIDDQTSTDMVVREGSNVSLSCAATGSPTPNITWRREDNQKILLDNGLKVSSVEGPYLNITKVNRLHMGPYLCIASNGVPPSVSKRIKLIVQFTPMIWIQNQLVGTELGQPVTLECHSEAFPKSINYWTRDKNDIVAQGGKYDTELIDNAYKVRMKLTIHSVTESDYGAYKCVSRNSLGDTDSTIKLYRKLKKNSGNHLLEGNQDMLKERDLKLRGRKDSGENEDDEDYEYSSGAASPRNYSDSGLVAVLGLFSLFCLNYHLYHHHHHQSELRTFRPV